MTTALTATFRRSSIWKALTLQFQSSRQHPEELSGGLLHCLRIVVASVGASSENSKGLDRDDHAAAQIVEVRTFHTDKANGVFRLWARH